MVDRYLTWSVFNQVTWKLPVIPAGRLMIFLAAVNGKCSIHKQANECLLATFEQQDFNRKAIIYYNFLISYCI